MIFLACHNWQVFPIYIDMNAKDKEYLIKMIKSSGKKKTKPVKEYFFKIDNVSSQYFAETEVLAKNYSGEKSLNLRKSLRMMIDGQQ